MNKLEREVVSRLIGSTNSIVERYRCLAAIYFGEKHGCKEEVIKMVLSAQLEWLNWITITQRRWQKETKNQNKARHHDSIALREKYVRCHI